MLKWKWASLNFTAVLHNFEPFRCSGIILYGMVMGQLPFVNARTDTATSQERRKRLVAQINRGLATPHRRAMAPFSAEFRHIMNRLLIADSSKRMTTKELLGHPWITDKGRKLVRTNPFKILDSHWQAKIITEIGSLLEVDPKSVMSSISQEPLGKVGGMFNVLVHKHQLNQLNGDGVTRTTPSLTQLDIPDAQKNSSRDRTVLRISTARNAQQKKPSLLTLGPRTDYCTPRPIPEEKKVECVQTPKSKTANSKPVKKESSVAKVTRPSTTQTNADKAYQMLDYRTIKSPTLRRKAYSANINTRNAVPCSPTVERSKLVVSSQAKDRSPKEEAVRKCLHHELPLIGRRGISEAINAIRKLPLNNPKQENNRSLEPRIRTANADRPRSKSDHATGGKRPFSSSLNRPTQRSAKPTGPSPVTISQSTTAAREIRKNVNCISAPREKKEVVMKPEQWEKSPFACGDTLARTTPCKQGRTPIIYDPIARSIAGYVANNVPEKLHNVRLFFVCK
ncbi:hypothetical protein NQ318_018522 [Aromia moschata]|uniref:Protein kinase domain-containing protein n=1 Tax=Aromia moschata TaxID=1265417 RepID=A0AAV8ZFU2_9CUCU|nr:hypothetical protein NQ318_018522 [Aromia moschata]